MFDRIFLSISTSLCLTLHKYTVKAQFWDEECLYINLFRKTLYQQIHFIYSVVNTFSISNKRLL